MLILIIIFGRKDAVVGSFLGIDFFNLYVENNPATFRDMTLKSPWK
jgi:hypothetical protein